MMRTRVSLMPAGVLLVVVAVGWFAARAGQAPQAPQVKADRDAAEPALKDDKSHESDREDIQKSAREFEKAIEKGDNKAVAAFWTEEGEYIGEEGTTLRGRKAIEAAYTKAFAKNPKRKLEFVVESIRFPSKDTAIEEGYAKSFKGNAEQPTTSRYSILHVRDGGRWLMAVLREWPDEAVSLHDLDWLIGSWGVKTEDAEVHSTYEWDAKKNAIHCHFTIKTTERNVTGTQIILKDPRTGLLRSWQFDDDGGFGDSAWTRDGKRWVLEVSGVQTDGGELAATNILTSVDKDTFTWQSTERTLDGEELPNIPPVKVKRVK